MTLSILVGLWALAIVIGVILRVKDGPVGQKKTPDYLTICGEEWPGVGTCQRNGGHGGAHSFVSWPRRGTQIEAQWTTEPAEPARPASIDPQAGSLGTGDHDTRPGGSCAP